MTTPTPTLAMTPTGSYFKACTVLNEMLSDRGFSSLPYTLHLKDMPTFESWLSSGDLRSLTEVKEALSCRVARQQGRAHLYIRFIDGPSLNTNIRSVYADILSHGDKRAILIYDDSITSNAKHILDNVSHIHITTFKLNHLQFNITKHIFQPIFTVLTKEQKQTVMDTMGATESQLPKIQSWDPICKYYGVKRGTLFRTFRKRPNGIEEIAYRLVI